MFERPRPVSNRRRRLMFALLGAALAVAALAAVTSLIPMTQADFHLPGTQIGDVPAGVLGTSGECRGLPRSLRLSRTSPCSTGPAASWASRASDPLFYAQMTTANQDVANAGYFCLRCHVPMSFVTGHALDPTGGTLDAIDATA